MKHLLNRYLRLSLTASEWLYMVKGVIGILICYIFYKAFPQYPFHWSMISVVLVFTPDNDQTLAFDRMKANVLGSVIGLMVFLLPVPDVLIFCLGVVLTILAGLVFRLENTIRPALAAVVIVLVQESKSEEWIVALERVGCVLIGCFIALLITLIFTKAAWARFYYRLKRTAIRIRNRN